MIAAVTNDMLNTSSGVSSCDQVKRKVMQEQ